MPTKLVAGVGSGWGRNDTLSRFAMPADNFSDGVLANTKISGNPSGGPGSNGTANRLKVVAIRFSQNLHRYCLSERGPFNAINLVPAK